MPRYIISTIRERPREPINNIELNRSLEIDENVNICSVINNIKYRYLIATSGFLSALFYGYSEILKLAMLSTVIKHGFGYNTQNVTIVNTISICVALGISYIFFYFCKVIRRNLVYSVSTLGLITISCVPFIPRIVNNLSGMVALTICHNIVCICFYIMDTIIMSLTNKIQNSSEIGLIYSISKNVSQIGGIMIMIPSLIIFKETIQNPKINFIICFLCCNIIYRMTNPDTFISNVMDSTIPQKKLQDVKSMLENIFEQKENVRGEMEVVLHKDYKYILMRQDVCFLEFAKNNLVDNWKEIYDMDYVIVELKKEITTVSEPVRASLNEMRNLFKRHYVAHHILFKTRPMGTWCMIIIGKIQHDTIDTVESCEKAKILFTEKVPAIEQKISGIAEVMKGYATILSLGEINTKFTEANNKLEENFLANLKEQKESFNKINEKTQEKINQIKDSTEITLASLSNDIKKKANDTAVLIMNETKKIEDHIVLVQKTQNDKNDETNKKLEEQKKYTISATSGIVASTDIKIKDLLTKYDELAKMSDTKFQNITDTTTLNFREVNKKINDANVTTLDRLKAVDQNICDTSVLHDKKLLDIITDVNKKFDEVDTRIVNIDTKLGTSTKDILTAVGKVNSELNDKLTKFGGATDINFQNVNKDIIMANNKIDELLETTNKTFGNVNAKITIADTKLIELGQSINTKLRGFVDTADNKLVELGQSINTKLNGFVDTTDKNFEKISSQFIVSDSNFNEFIEKHGKTIENINLNITSTKNKFNEFSGLSDKNFENISSEIETVKSAIDELIASSNKKFNEHDTLHSSTSERLTKFED